MPRLTLVDGRRDDLGVHEFHSIPAVGDSICIPYKGENEDLEVVSITYLSRSIDGAADARLNLKPKAG